MHSHLEATNSHQSSTVVAAMANCDLVLNSKAPWTQRTAFLMFLFWLSQLGLNLLITSEHLWPPAASVCAWNKSYHSTVSMHALCTVPLGWALSFTWSHYSKLPAVSLYSIVISTSMKPWWEDRWSKGMGSYIRVLVQYVYVFINSS